MTLGSSPCNLASPSFFHGSKLREILALSVDFKELGTLATGVN